MSALRGMSVSGALSARPANSVGSGMRSALTGSPGWSVWLSGTPESPPQAHKGVFVGRKPGRGVSELPVNPEDDARFVNETHKDWAGLVGNTWETCEKDIDIAHKRIVLTAVKRAAQIREFLPVPDHQLQDFGFGFELPATACRDIKQALPFVPENSDLRRVLLESMTACMGTGKGPCMFCSSPTHVAQHTLHGCVVGEVVAVKQEFAVAAQQGRIEPVELTHMRYSDLILQVYDFEYLQGTLTRKLLSPSAEMRDQALVAWREADMQRQAQERIAAEQQAREWRQQHGAGMQHGDGMLHDGVEGGGEAGNPGFPAGPGVGMFGGPGRGADSYGQGGRGGRGGRGGGGGRGAGGRGEGEMEGGGRGRYHSSPSRRQRSVDYRYRVQQETMSIVADFWMQMESRKRMRDEFEDQQFEREMKLKNGGGPGASGHGK